MELELSRVVKLVAVKSGNIIGFKANFISDNRLFLYLNGIGYILGVEDDLSFNHRFHYSLGKTFSDNYKMGLMLSGL